MAFSETPVEHAGESMSCHSWHVNSESTSAMSGLLCSAAWDQQVWELHIGRCGVRRTNLETCKSDEAVYGPRKYEGAIYREIESASGFMLCKAYN